MFVAEVPSPVEIMDMNDLKSAVTFEKKLGLQHRQRGCLCHDRGAQCDVQYTGDPRT